MLKKVFRIFFVTVLAIYLSNKFNVFDYIPFVSGEKSFDICLTVYISILQYFSEYLLGIVESKYTSKISAIFSLSNNDISIEDTPRLTINNIEMAKIKLTIQINGLKKHFLGSKIKISNPNIVTMQVNCNDNEAYVDNQGNYIVDLEKIFGDVEIAEDLSYSFTINLIKEPVGGDRSTSINAEFKTSKFLKFHPYIKYTNNNLKLKVEGDNDVDYMLGR